MGIQSANIKHENRGSIRRAEVKIKAHNKYQFDIIDTLYLRLGFSVLLEWGHSIIINNTEEIDTNPLGLSLSDEFITGKKTYDELLQVIYDRRLESGGNYDAMLAKVANFSWSFLPDGTYDITLYLSSIGDLIESLKINSLIDSPGTNNTVVSTNQNSESNTNTIGGIIDSYAYSHTIGHFLYTAKSILNTISSVDNSVTSTRLNPTNNDERKAIIQSVLDTSGAFKFDPQIFTPDESDILSIPFTSLGNYIDTSGKNMRDRRYYIRLGTFLNFLQVYIAPFYSNKDNVSSPSLTFDFDENTNLMNVNPLQVGVDPRICIVSRPISFQTSDGSNTELRFGIADPIYSPFLNTTVSSGIGKPGIFYGNIMNIYVDFTFILSKIDILKDDKGNVALIDFLQGLLRGINEGLGGINDLDVFLDETNNTIRIIDKNPLNNVGEVINILNQNFSGSILTSNNNRLLNPIEEISEGTLQLFGYSPNINEPTKAGFIKEFDLKTEISSKFSTLITYGAAARGTSVGENATALNKLNVGLVDRFKKSINNDSKSTLSNDETNYSNQIESYKRIYSDYIGFLYKLSTKVNDKYFIMQVTDNDIDTFKGTLSSLVQKSIEINKFRQSLKPAPNVLSTGSSEKIPEEFQGTGFLPFNLSLTMDGLSGIKINQQFYLDTSYMPSNYPNTLRFVIRNLNHEIRNNKWTTKIETFSIPKAIAEKSSLEIIEGVDFSTLTPSPVPSQPLRVGELAANAETIYRFFISKGFTDYQAAAWVGNLQQESGLNPRIINSIGAYGIAQWLDYTNPKDGRKDLRKSRLLAKPGYDTLQVQLNYIWEELNASERAAYRTIKATTTIELATLAIRKSYERPGEKEANDAARLAYAKKAFAKFSKKSTSAVSSSDSQRGRRVITDPGGSGYGVISTETNR